MQESVIKDFFARGKERIYITNHKIFDKINAFTYSAWFYAILSVLTCIFWQFQLTTLAIIFYVSLLAIFLFIQKDLTILVPIVMNVLLSIADTSNIPALVKFWPVAIPVGLSIIFHIIYYTSPFKTGRMFWPYVAITVACALGGVASIYFKATFTSNLINTIIVTIIPFFCYILLQNYTVPRKDKNYSIAIAKFFVFLGVTVFVQLCLWTIKNPTAFERDIVPHLGWSISNTVATVLLFSIPMGFYLFVKEKKFSFGYLFMGILCALGIVITTSRGALLFGVIVTGLCGIITIFYAKGEKRVKYLFFVGLAFVFALTMLYVVKDKIEFVVNTIFHDKFKSNGRLELYQEALQCFAKFPVFGAGLSYPGVNSHVIDKAKLYMFHSTVFQVVGSLGIVGIIAFLYFYFIKIESLFENFNIFSAFVGMIYIGFEGYSLINTGTITGALFGPIVALVSIAIEINSNLTPYIRLKKTKLFKE